MRARRDPEPPEPEHQAGRAGHGAATLAFYGAYVIDTVRPDHAGELDLADLRRST